jgi:hypothetical protein
MPQEDFEASFVKIMDTSLPLLVRSKEAVTLLEKIHLFTTNPDNHELVQSWINTYVAEHSLLIPSEEDVEMSDDIVPTVIQPLVITTPTKVTSTDVQLPSSNSIGSLQQPSEKLPQQFHKVPSVDF